MSAVLDARRAYLRGLAWDDFVRVKTVPFHVLDAPSTEQADRFAAWMTDAVRRTFEPGAVVGAPLVVAGPQGTRKTWFLRELFGADAYAEPHESPTDRDAWVVCASDGETLPPAMLKTWNEYTADAHGRPRTYVNAATTNSDAWAVRAAAAGAYVVPVQSAANIKLLTTWRDQLWAEAVHLYRAAGGAA